MKHSESLKAIAPALRKAQAAIHGVVANADNPFFKSKYADLGACWGAIKGALHAEGISLVQTLGFIPGAGPTLITTLLHESGEYISGEQPVCAKSDDPQAMGSAISYARRYGLSAIVSLVEVDDDGEGAMKRPGSFEGAEDIPPFIPPDRGEAGRGTAATGGTCPSCNGKMMISKYPNKVTGAFDFYCSKCKKSVPRLA